MWMLPMTLDLPRVGRYRVFDPATKLEHRKGHLWRCRLCGRVVTYAWVWHHWGVEVNRVVEDYGDDMWFDLAEARLEERLRAVLTRRRKDRHLRRSRWEYAVGRGKE